MQFEVATYLFTDNYSPSSERSSARPVCSYPIPSHARHTYIQSICVKSIRASLQLLNLANVASSSYRLSSETYIIVGSTRRAVLLEICFNTMANSCCLWICRATAGIKALLCSRVYGRRVCICMSCARARGTPATYYEPRMMMMMMMMVMMHMC